MMSLAGRLVWPVPRLDETIDVCGGADRVAEARRLVRSDDEPRSREHVRGVSSQGRRRETRS